MASKRGNAGRSMKYNPEDGSIMMYIRGRPLLLYAPSDIQDYDPNGASELPEQQLQMEWVYGYKGKGARNNLYALPTGEIVYFIAGVVILYDVKNKTQRHYLEHSDDIKCMALHPSEELIASGQVAGRDPEAKPQVRIWEYRTLNTVIVLGLGHFQRAVSCVTFSNAKNPYIVAIDDSNNHTLSVWDWKEGKLVTESKTSNEEVLGVTYHPSSKRFVTYGKKHLAFWNFNGKLLSKKSGILGNRNKPKVFTCALYLKCGNLLVGDDKGSILLWEGDSNDGIKSARDDVHDGAVLALTQIDDNTILSGGGKSPTVIQWDAGLNVTGPKLKVTGVLGSVRAICQAEDGELFVGTTRNGILRGFLDQEMAPLMSGHIQDLVALSTHPSEAMFVTAGHDKYLRSWDAVDKRMEWEIELEDGISSIAFSKDGTRIVAGSLTGKCYLIDAVLRKVLQEVTDAKEAIEATDFSPDGSRVATGSRDNMIYVYQLDDGMDSMKRIGRCSGHSSFVLHLDWSANGKFIRTASGDYELLYWDAEKCKQITSTSEMRDEYWATQWCVLGFAVIGIWPEGADGTDINCVAGSHNRKCLASGDDFGNVKLFSYPVSTQRALNHCYPGHSSHVTRVAFLKDDSKLISTGGYDSSIIQWSVC